MTDILPSFLDIELWDDYKAYRKELKRPLTAIAEKRAIRKLKLFHEQGNNITEVIENTIHNNWLGFFPIKIKVDIKDEHNIARAGKKLNIKPLIGESSFDYARRVLVANRG
jgi:hypothetical protein